MTFLICAHEFLMSFCSFAVAAAGYDLSSKRLLSRLIRTSASEAVLIFDLMDVAAAAIVASAALSRLAPWPLHPAFITLRDPRYPLREAAQNFESILNKREMTSIDQWRHIYSPEK